jgi:hypothetical protein
MHHTAYMVEVWPYMERSRGIAIFQLFGRLAGFFTTFVNPIGLKNITWKWLVVYCCWLAYEVVFCWFFFPETANRTLEELAFCEFCFPVWGDMWEERLLMRLQCLRMRLRLGTRRRQLMRLSILRQSLGRTRRTTRDRRKLSSHFGGLHVHPAEYVTSC